MENVLSAATKWVTKGLAAAVLVVMYALGMGASAPAAAHGWHCGSESAATGISGRVATTSSGVDHLVGGRVAVGVGRRHRRRR